MKMNLLFYLLLLLHSACQNNALNNQSQDNAVKVQPTKSAEIVPDTFDCRLHGMQLKGSEYWMKEKQMLFAIAAQGEDINGSAPIYRTFQVYTTNDCNMISYSLMPYNRDNIPYLLQASTYDEENELLCAQGYDYAFCYHVRRKEFLLPLVPKYLTPRRQSKTAGKPLGMAVWDQFVFAQSEQNGAFAYDVSERSMPKPVLPSIEYLDHENKTFKQAFLLNGKAGLQVVMPYMDNGQLQMKTLLPEGTAIENRLIPSRPSGRFAIARTKADAKPIVFDLKTSKRLDLPKDLNDTGKILGYLKSKYQ